MTDTVWLIYQTDSITGIDFLHGIATDATQLEKIASELQEALQEESRKIPNKRTERVVIKKRKVNELFHINT